MGRRRELALVLSGAMLGLGACSFPDMNFTSATGSSASASSGTESIGGGGAGASGSASSAGGSPASSSSSASSGTGGGPCLKLNDCDDDGDETTTDCDDANKSVFHGQGAWFTKPYGANNFDYNCDGDSDANPDDLFVGSCSDLGACGAKLVQGFDLDSAKCGSDSFFYKCETVNVVNCVKHQVQAPPGKLLSCH